MVPSSFMRVAHLCFINQLTKKNDIGWPQQPPTEKVPKLNMIFHDSIQNFFFFQNEKIRLNSNA